jgi:hypothetical protein
MSGTTSPSIKLMDVLGVLFSVGSVLVAPLHGRDQQWLSFHPDISVTGRKAGVCSTIDCIEGRSLA